MPQFYSQSGLIIPRSSYQVTTLASVADTTEQDFYGYDSPAGLLSPLDTLRLYFCGHIISQNTTAVGFRLKVWFGTTAGTAGLVATGSNVQITHAAATTKRRLFGFIDLLFVSATSLKLSGGYLGETTDQTELANLSALCTTIGAVDTVTGVDLTVQNRAKVTMTMGTATANASWERYYGRAEIIRPPAF